MEASISFCRAMRASHQRRYVIAHVHVHQILRQHGQLGFEGDRIQRCVVLLEAGLHLVAHRRGGQHAVIPSLWGAQVADRPPYHVATRLLDVAGAILAMRATTSEGDAARLAIAHQMIDELAAVVVAIRDSPLQNCPSDQNSAPQA